MWLRGLGFEVEGFSVEGFRVFGGLGLKASGFKMRTLNLGVLVYQGYTLCVPLWALVRRVEAFPV